MKKDNKLCIFSICIIILSVYFLINIVTGRLLADNHYNSYMLQARSWLEGRLHLGKDYPHLELAIYESKYFVSFPPFPSYIMLPFAALGLYRADAFITLFFSILSGIYAYKIIRCFEKPQITALFWGLFITVGSNWLFNATTPWVWFIAQNMAFALSLMSIYYALRKKAALSFAFWACAVGCRPFQALYIFVLLYILFTEYKKDGISVKEMILKNLYALIAPCAIAASYMILNYMRFGSIFEFGHNYLPEFTRVSTGQFNISYLSENIKSLFRLPLVTNNGNPSWIGHNGFCIFIASPVFVSYVVYMIRSLIKGKADKKLIILIAISLILHLFVITLHKTMGGAHYGNRYTNDLLPFVLLSLSLTVKEKPSIVDMVLFVVGAVLNIHWAILYFG